MKKYIFPVCMDVLLVFLLSIGSVSCMVTGFDMNVSPVILLTALACAAICCVCWRVKFGWIALVVLLALYGYGFYKLEAYESFFELLQIVGVRYYRAYGWDIGGIFAVADSLVQYADVTASCTAILILQALVVSLVLRERYSVIAALPVVLLPLVTTLVTIDSVPALESIFVLLLGLVLLVLTHGARRREEAEGAKLTAMLLAPVALALCILLSLVPRSSYEKPNFQEGDFSFLFPTVTMPPMTLPPVTLPPIDVTLPPVTLPPDIGGNKVNLDMVGPQNQLARRVMNIRSELPGTIYLRSHSYATYLGIQWDTKGASEAENMELPFDYWGDRSGKLLISDRFAHDYYFTPYYADGGLTLNKGLYPNPAEEKEYAYISIPIRDDWMLTWEEKHSGMDTSVAIYETDTGFNRTYLKLSDNTTRRARELLDTLELPEDTDILKLADAIRAYVRASASYDLNTAWMPDGEVDFAIWFLTESDTGYCIHFATAATVLLRAAGIPARYVEGYMVSTGEMTDQMYDVEVQQKHAHAWVEYYVPDLGWVLMDPTPAIGENLPPLPTDPTQPTIPPTVPPTVPPTTEPTVPTTGTTSPETSTTVPTEPQTSASVPESSGTVEQPRQAVPGWLWKTALWIAGLILLLAGQWFARLRLREKWLSSGTTNKRAVRLWRYGAFLGKLLKMPAPDSLFELAQKAGFSQYTITEEELAAAEGYLQAALAAAKQRNIFLRAVYRVVFALY